MEVEMEGEIMLGGIGLEEYGILVRILDLRNGN